MVNYPSPEGSGFLPITNERKIYKKMTGQKNIFAVSGVKNSGKTTLICKLLEIFKGKGLKAAVLKHDGHDFEPDVETYYAKIDVLFKNCIKELNIRYMDKS